MIQCATEVTAHATGLRNLRASLQRALDTRQPHVMPEQQYDIRRGGGRRLRGAALAPGQPPGAPIPAAAQGRIFEPLQRADAPADPASRSVGLGLFIVKHLVDAHGGTIAVTSADGAGTTFTVQLPRGVPGASG